MGDDLIEEMNDRILELSKVHSLKDQDKKEKNNEDKNKG